MQNDPPDDPPLEFDDDLQQLAADVPRGFDEDAYLEAFPDIAQAIRRGEWKSALDHYLKHGVGEHRLADPRYVRASKAGPGATEPAAAFPAFGVDVVFASRSGFCVVIGWVDDRERRLEGIGLILRGRTVVATKQIARSRRVDAENVLGIPGVHLLGFWTVLRLPKNVAVPTSFDIELMVRGAAKTVALEPRLMSDTQLRDTMFEYVAAANYLGNPQVESFVQLSAGPGAELMRFNLAISSAITAQAYVERYGPQRKKFDGSIIVCLYGKPEFLFLQSALFSACRGMENYEFIYVSNSPELTETLQREARIAERIYGLTQTLVFLPGNAGFGAANNAAVRFSRSNRLLIVNPDVFPRDMDWPQTHSKMISGLPREQTSMFGVPLFYDDGSLMHSGMHFEIDTGLSVRPEGISPQMLIRVEHYGKGAPPGTAAFLRARPVPAVTGAFIAADRAWFEKLGGFSEDYVFGHYEDADLCLKSLSAGRPVWMHNIPFWHLEGKGSDRRPAHDGGSLINRWHFTRTWGERIATDLFGRDPAFFRAAELTA